ncbi:MAG: hypothetical protein AB8I08_08165 [Sandaracinaceae bacterium]
MSSAKKSSDDTPAVEGLWSETPAPAPVVEDVPSVMRSLLSPDAPSAADARPKPSVAPAERIETSEPIATATESTAANAGAVDAGVDAAVEDSIRMLLAGFDDSFEEPTSPAPEAPASEAAAPEAPASGSAESEPAASELEPTQAPQPAAEAIVVGEEPSSGVRDSGDFIALHSGEIEIVGLLEEAARRAPRAAPMPPSPTRRKEESVAGPRPAESAPVESADASARSAAAPDEPRSAVPDVEPDDEPVDAATLLKVQSEPDALLSEDPSDEPVDAAVLLAVVEPPLEEVAQAADPPRSAAASSEVTAMPLRKKKKKRTKSGASTAAAGTGKKLRKKKATAKGAGAKKSATRKKSSKAKRPKKLPQPEPRGDLGDSWAHQDEPSTAGSRVDLDNIVDGLERPAAAAAINSVPGPAPLPSVGSPPPIATQEEESGGWDISSGGVGLLVGLAVAAALYMFVLRPQTVETPETPPPVAAAIADEPAPIPEPATSIGVQPPSPAVEEPPQAELAAADLDLEQADLDVPAPPARVAPPRSESRPARVQPRAPRPAAVAPAPVAPEPQAAPAPVAPEPAPAPAPVQATPAPTPAPAPPSGGRPSRAEVEAAIMQQADGIRACAPEHHNHIASIRFTFGSTGRVMSAIVDSGFATPQARSCVARAARAVRVPPFSDSRLSVTYPMRF